MYKLQVFDRLHSTLRVQTNKTLFFSSIASYAWIPECHSKNLACVPSARPSLPRSLSFSYTERLTFVRTSKFSICEKVPGPNQERMKESIFLFRCPGTPFTFKKNPLAKISSEQRVTKNEKYPENRRFIYLEGQ